MPPKQPFRTHANGRWLERWRWLLVGVFGYGSAVHVVQLAVSVGRPYEGNPWWLVVFFVSLTVFDPAVAVGLAQRRRWAVWSATVLLVLDAVANGYAVYVVVPAPGLTLARVSQGIITVLAIVATVAARPLNRRFASHPRSGLVSMTDRVEG
jgi:hypothetical protein